MTNDDGEIFFDGADYDFYFDKVYHVQEIEEPEDYGKIGFDYLVTLTNNMAKVDYVHFIYYYSDSMQIKNWPLEGLVVEKQVESDVAADKNRYYTFRVSILNEEGAVNTDYNEKNGDDQFENGVVEFQIKDKEQKMFWGFMKGTRYKVEEIDADGFVTTVTYSIFDQEGQIIDTKTESGASHIGELTQEDEVIIFKNTKQNEVGSLKIKKTVTENGSSTLSDAAKAKLAGDYTFIVYTDENCTIPLQKDDANVTVTLTIPTDGSSVTSEEITDIPAGTYYVKETAPTTSNPSPVTNPVTVTVEAGKTGAETVIATITNDYKHVEAAPKVNKSINVWPESVTSFDFKLTAGTNTAGVTTPMPASGGETASATSKTSPAIFGTITFEAPGTYNYTIKEVVPEDDDSTTEGIQKDGVTYTDTEYPVQIVVEADSTTGQLKTPVIKYGAALENSLTVTNTYAAKGAGEAKVQKTLDGREWTDDDEFTFTISAADGTPMPEETSITIKKADADQTKSFGEIAFTEAGTYTYTVKETKGTAGGVTYDETEHTMTIKVKDNGQGNLVADGTPLIQTEKITNTYSKSGKGEIKVQKKLIGREWTEDDEFTFTISAADGIPMPAETSITIKKADADQTKSFGEIAFTEAGTYTYTVKETKGTAGGVTYDETEHTVTIKVKDDGQGNLVADGTPLIQTEKITNTYSKSGEGEAKAQKNLIGRDWTTDDSFEFTITPVGSAPAFPTSTVTVTKNSTGYTESFGKVTFTKAGTYKWTVSEAHKGETIDGVAYDTADKTITMVVVDDGKGNLVADTGSALVQTAAFTNTYSKSGEGEAKAQKNLIGRDWTTDDSFEFTITPIGTAPAFPTPTVTVTKNSTGYTESFGKVTFTKAGTYKWTVSETHKGETIDGVAYDTADKTITIVVVDDGKGNLVADTGSALVQTAAFTNTYSKSSKGEIKVQKILEGREWTEDDEFTFTISAAEGTPMPAETSITIKKADEDQTKSFGEITFTAAGEYSYTVKETKGTAGGVTYDETEHTVTIKVKDDGQGNLVADGTPLIQTEKVTNTYDAIGKYVPGAKKILYGRKLQANEFRFTLTAVDESGNALTGEAAYSKTVTNAADGTVTFPEINYLLSDLDQVDGHTVDTKKYYRIEEDIPYPEEKDMAYSTAVYKIAVTLHDNGDGVIASNPDKKIESIVFTNNYSPERYDYKFGFTKKWAGGREDSIDWVLYSADGTVVHKKFNKKTVSENEWYYEAWFQSDSELYLIETAPRGYQVRYENIGEHADVTDRCYNGGTIINYKVPVTGDGFKPILWIGCVLSGLTLLGGTCLILKRKKKN